MILYHGSTYLVKKPEIREWGNALDFGIGFYTTTSYKQAERWAKIKMQREKKRIGYVTEYAFDYDAAVKNTVITHFLSADLEWLHYVVNNRRANPSQNHIDMHIGPVADDTMYQSIRLFETGILNAEETVKRLKTEVLQDQWAFHTEKALQYCRYRTYTEIK